MRAFGNWLGARFEDVRLLEDHAAFLREEGGYAEVLRPHPHWLIAVAPLPDTPAAPTFLARQGFVFGEGREDLEPILERRGPNAGLVTLTELASLPGDFCFLQVAAGGEALAVKSCAGVVPVYFAERSDRLLIGTQLGKLAQLLDDVELDIITNVAKVSGLSPWVADRTLLKGVASLLSGSALFARPRETARSYSYWKRPTVDTCRGSPASVQQEYGKELARLVTSNLESDLDNDGRSLLALSGGVDSAILACVARRSLGCQFRSKTWLPRTAAERAHEERFLLPLVSKLQLDWEWDVQLDPAEKLDLRRAHSPHALIHCTQDDFCLFADEVRRHQTRVFFNGHFADLLFDDRGQQTEDWVSLASVWELLSAQSLPAARWRLLRTRVRQLMRRTGTIRGQKPLLWRGVGVAARDQFLHWFEARVASPTGPEVPDGPFRHDLHVRLNATTYKDPFWEAASTLGARCAFPFMSRGLVELAYRVPPRAHLPGPKRLLRIGFAGSVSKLNLERSDKGLSTKSGLGAVAWGSTPIPSALAELVSPELLHLDGQTLPAHTALRLEWLVGMVRALCRTCKKRLPIGKSTNAPFS